MIARSLAAIAVVGALVAVLLACWPSATARSRALTPTGVASQAPFSRTATMHAA